MNPEEGLTEDQIRAGARVSVSSLQRPGRYMSVEATRSG